MIRASMALVASALLACGAIGDAQEPAARPAVTPCATNQISTATDAEGGNFDGMSHGGALLVLRNTSPTACALAPFPKLVANDEHGRALDVGFDVTTGFEGPVVNGKRLPIGHGPVVLPIVVAGGAEATSTMRWVSSPVFDRSVCVDVASLAVEVGGNPIRTAVSAHVCGSDAGHIRITASRLALDPVYTP